MSVQSMLIKRAQSFLNKTAFQPMPGGQPPADPNAQPPMDPSQMGGAPGGAPAPQQGGQPPMDPSQMGGQPPMDPSMMGGQPGMGMPGMGMGMDPNMMAQTSTIGSLSITDFQAVMTDMLTNILQQIVPALVDEIKGAAMGAGAPPAPEGVDPSQVAPQGDDRGVSNTEISQKLDALLDVLAQGAAGGAPAAGGMPPEAGPEMGFGGQSMPPPAGPAGPAASAAPGMEVSAGVRPTRRNGLADVIIKRAMQARKG